VKLLPTALPEVIVIKPRVFGDARGFFLETWNARAFGQAGIDATFVQDNHSRSAKGVLRGIHYQVRQTQGKLVRVVQGAVFDVAVDVRRGSPTFGRWVGEELSEANARMMWVPPGFAHGFLVLSDSADFLYKCTDFYAPEYERTLAWNDPAVGVEWPLGGMMPTVSTKDAAGALLAAIDPL
jgi:dTDP-4-dehydrorhamnose 3,5-epimerase